MAQQNNKIIKIAKKVCPAVITIVVSKDLPKIEGFYVYPSQGQNFVIPKLQKGKQEKKKIGGGSGFIVSKDGYVLTSNHVVGDKQAEYTIVCEPEEKYPAEVISRDPLNDVAILKIKGNNFPYLPMADSSKAVLGEAVLAVGNVLGEFQDTVSSGIISGLSRYITARQDENHPAEKLKGLIQTDAAVNPGNSGGPLVNMKGEAIGINTATVMKAQNIGFAIPINYAKKDLEEIKKYGKLKRPFLGIRYILLTEEIAKKNKLPVSYGALILRQNLGEPAIIKGSSAEKAGLKEFDIILECHGEKITENNSLAQILQNQKIGNTISLKVLRNKKELTLKAKVEEKK